MNKEINYNYKLPPFKWFCLTNFPFIEADFDALTYYELLCKVVQYLNEVIVKTNAIGEQTEELTNAFNTLKEYVDTYFENLDVQEEINNKLDEMAEDGTLQEIISEYLNSTAIFGFDNVNDMVCATNLIDGSYAKTMGFNSLNDGGSKNYKIVEEQSATGVDGMTKISMGHDDLYAVAINDEINVRSYGAYGDGVHDDYTVLQALINKFPHRTLYFPDGKYKISQPLSIKAGNDYQVNINMQENAILFTTETINALIEVGKTYGGAWDRYQEGNSVHIKGGLLNCDHVTYGIYLTSDQKSTILENLNLINVDRYGIYIANGTHSNVSADAKIMNCQINGKTSATTNEGTGIFMQATDNMLDDITMLRMKIAFDIVGGGNKISNVHVCTAWEDTISDEAFNSTIAFKYRDMSYENVSNIYLDTYSTGFSFNGESCKINISNVVAYYWYAGNENVATKIFDVNTTVSSNNRIFVDNVFITLPNNNGRNNTILDLDDAGSGYREFLPCYNSIYINNISYDLHKIKPWDYINVMQLRKLDGLGLVPTWSTTMVQNQYYPIALVNRGFHEFDFRHDNTVMANVKINVASTVSSSTITTTNILGNSTVLSLALLDVGIVDKDNRPLLVLAEKSSGTGVSLNPSISNVKYSWMSRVYTAWRFPTHSYIDLTNPTIIASSNLNT